MKLRPYQIEDATFLSTLDTGACFNEQRTGKTPTILEVVRQKNCRKVLIVCPNSAIPQWKEEYNKWLHKPCIAMVGTKAKKEKQIKLWTNGLVIGYDSLKNTATYTGFIDEIIKMKPDMVILDEAHRIKNPKSANAKAAFKLIKVPLRFVLTATPAHNKPEDIYSLLHFIKPDVFRSYWSFVYEYMLIENCYMGRRSFKKIIGFDPRKEVELQYYLQKISTQRKRKTIMQWLPDKDYQQIMLDPTDAQKKYLQELNDYYETENIITKGTVDRLMRYRQICQDPALLGLKGSSPKTDWIIHFLKEYPEKSTIIFSKFTTYIQKLKKELQFTNCECIIGSTPVPKRAEIVKDFQNKKVNVLLINIDAGKEALTLDRADVTIFADKYPPYGDIAQAEDRFIATTKDKATKEHTIYELILKDTYDEQIYKLLKERATTNDVINNYKKYIKESV